MQGKQKMPRVWAVSEALTKAHWLKQDFKNWHTNSSSCSTDIYTWWAAPPASSPHVKKGWCLVDLYAIRQHGVLHACLGRRELLVGGTRSWARCAPGCSPRTSPPDSSGICPDGEPKSVWSFWKAMGNTSFLVGIFLLSPVALVI